MEQLKQVVRTVTKERAEARASGARAMDLTRSLSERAADSLAKASRAESEAELCRGAVAELRDEQEKTRSECSRLQVG